MRALCDEFGIVMAIDEASVRVRLGMAAEALICKGSVLISQGLQVMSGWGRTGKLFGFQHSDGVIPDLVGQG